MGYQANMNLVGRFAISAMNGSNAYYDYIQSARNHKIDQEDVRSKDLSIQKIGIRSYVQVDDVVTVVLAEKLYSEDYADQLQVMIHRQGMAIISVWMVG